MKRIAIINADDCNLTPGVTDAILKCHDQGVVSSTTWLANLPFSDNAVRAVLKRKGLGVGIHLNVTLGSPVSPATKVKSLVEPDGRFKKLPRQMGKLPALNEVIFEYTAQIEKFKQIFGCLPTHLDTHHQVHDHPLFFKAFTRIASRYDLPVRRSCLMLSRKEKLKTTDFFFGNFTPAGYWRKNPFETLIRNLPEGISEFMCHPGYNDKKLRAVSSFTSGRKEEMQLLSSRRLRDFLKEQEVELKHFGLGYPQKK